MVCGLPWHHHHSIGALHYLSGNWQTDMWRTKQPLCAGCRGPSIWAVTYFTFPALGTGLRSTVSLSPVCVALLKTLLKLLFRLPAAANEVIAVQHERAYRQTEECASGQTVNPWTCGLDQQLPDLHGFTHRAAEHQIGFRCAILEGKQGKRMDLPHWGLVSSAVQF